MQRVTNQRKTLCRYTPPEVDAIRSRTLHAHTCPVTHVHVHVHVPSFSRGTRSPLPRTPYGKLGRASAPSWVFHGVKCCYAKENSSMRSAAVDWQKAKQPCQRYLCRRCKCAARIANQTFTAPSRPLDNQVQCIVARRCRAGRQVRVRVVHSFLWCVVAVARACHGHRSSQAR